MISTESLTMKIFKPFFNKNHSICAGAMGAILLLSPLSETGFAASGNDTTQAAEIKSELLNDQSFIKAVGEALNKQSSDDHIREVVKDYLVKNPEVMIEVQEALDKKQAQKVAENQTSTITSMKDEIFNSPNDAVIGNPKGKVSLVEFFDYNCGYCKKSYPDIQALLKNNPDLRIVLKDFPILGPDSVKAHIVARAFLKLMPMKYPAFHAEMLTSEGRANEEKAMKVAVKLGADEQKLREAMNDQKLQQAFVENGQIAYALNINGTPSYILGNEVLVGAVGENILKQKIGLLDK